jgi:hypothetical protein
MSSASHITEQLWVPEQREDGVYLVGDKDRSVVLRLCRPDRGSDLLLAGYIAGLQATRPHDPQLVEKRTADAIAQWLLDTRFEKPGREAEWSRFLAAQISDGKWRP